MEWFRSIHGAPTHRKWLSVARKSGQPVPLVVSVVWALMDHASRQQDRGSVASFDHEDLAAYLNVEDEAVEAVISTLADKDWLVDDRIASWEEHQVKRDDTSTARVREHRKRKKGGGGDDETQCNAVKRGETQRNAPEEDTDSDTEKEKKGRARAPSYAFEGKVIRLTKPDFETWRRAFHKLDLRAELTRLDAYYTDKPPTDGKWFNRVSRILADEHSKKPDGPYSGPARNGIDEVLGNG